MSKRKVDNMLDNIPLKQNCLHAEGCYRLNPHHFREYEHPHLYIYLNKELTDLPEKFTQPKSVYLDQIEMLKGLKIGGSSTTSTLTSQSNTTTSTISKPSTSSTTAHENPKKAAVPTNNKSESITLRLPAHVKTTKKKLEEAAPYNLFFTVIPSVPGTALHHNSITFQDLLCPSLGKLKDSLQINFIIDIIWLMQQYYMSNLHKLPMTVIYGDDFPSVGNYIKANLPHVSHQFVKLTDPFGTHHSKVGIYHYTDDSIRVVVSTANLYEQDWTIYNQGLWISPRCGRLPVEAPVSSGESATGFKASLIGYLKSYRYSCLGRWVALVERADFGEVNVFLVTSTPGYHKTGSEGGHMHRVAKLLTDHCTDPETAGSTIVAQSSSLGSYGASPSDWFLGCFLQTLSSSRQQRAQQALLQANRAVGLRLVYPSRRNVSENRFGPEGAGCLPYSHKVQEKQPWLNNYLCQWKADNLGRSRVMPHIKSYLRVSACHTKLSYFLLTSANVSKAAWGTKPKNDANKTSYVRSYEVGVLFLPSFFKQDYFTVLPKNGVSTDSNPGFPVMYDLPLLPYDSSDEPWANC